MSKHPSLSVVGAKIRALREASGYAQDTFAFQIGMNRGYYGHIERGNYNLTLLNLFKIADALNVEPGELMATLDTIRVAPIRSRSVKPVALPAGVDGAE